MKLSVVIVNYNVKYFLEQCLQSVVRACEGIDSEIFVVDNNSWDGSVAMVEEKFKQIKLIANDENLGFSKANNQAMRMAKGEYILLLNPDTVVEEDTFKLCIEFMDKHPKAGGLGVKMLDGKGIFLPESKRGLPTPQVSFFKIFGLSALFPKSTTFGRYHLGFLDKEEIHEIDILSGAFMWMRKSVLDKVGLLDEDYFMYGEDIDLSWRIRKAGFQNYYFPKTRIIHYKGESTKKGSINYVFVFYKAMVIFARKHFSSSYAGLFSFFIHLAIYFRATLSVIKRIVQVLFIPGIDFITIALALWFTSYFYQIFNHMVYPEQALKPVISVYSALMVISLFILGGYDLPMKVRNIGKGLFSGFVVALVFYALLPSDYRFSRAVILFGVISSLISVGTLRILYHLINIKGYNLKQNLKKRLAIVGGNSEFNRVRTLLEESGLKADFIVEVNPDTLHRKKTEHFVGKLSTINEIIEGFRLNELVFCSSDLSSDQIINLMTKLNAYNLEYKIAPSNSSFVIGSNSINSQGELYTLLPVNNINTQQNRRNKTILDLIVAFMVLFTFPVLFLIFEKPWGLLRNVFKVVTLQNTWVGYIPNAQQKKILPKLKPAILSIGNQQTIQNDILHTSEKINFNYANNYTIAIDLHYIWQKRRKLGDKAK